MPTYDEVKTKYEQDQAGMQQGVQQGAASARGVGGAINARDDEHFVNSAAEGIGTLVGLGIRSNRMAKQNAKIDAINQAMKLCDLQIDQGLPEEAINTATTHLISSDIVEAKVQGYLHRGQAQFNCSRYAEAVDDLSKVILIVEKSPAPLDSEALGDALPISYWGRGMAYVKQKQLADALRDYTKAIQLAPNWHAPYYSRSQALREIGEHERALADINQAISLQPGDADNYRERGKLHALLSSAEKALADFDKAVALNRSATNLRTRGQFYADRGDQSNALIDYSAALAVAPDDIATLKLRSALFERMGTHAEADTDRARAAELENRHSSFERYLDAAKAVYAKGITQVWTEADTHAKPNYLSAILQGVGAFLGTVLVLLLVALVLVAGNSDGNICLSLGLLLSPVLGVIVAINRIKKPKLQAKSAIQYFEEMAAHEGQMPRFSEFFEAYLAARANGTLSKLEESTRSLFARSMS